eukprot:3242501-Prymnesium_polylepis.1
MVRQLEFGEEGPSRTNHRLQRTRSVCVQRQPRAEVAERYCAVPRQDELAIVEDEAHAPRILLLEPR